MRLAALLLIAGVALAQTPAPVLPPWRTGLAGARPESLEPAPSPMDGTLRVSLTVDGTLRILDAAGVIRLRSGLPGRPLRAWRDWGIPVPLGQDGLAFPADTPLSRGVAALPWGEPDFRPALRGLLWILDDGESLLTVVHPATSQLLTLALPRAQEPEIIFHPDRLEVRERPALPAPREEARAWSVPWLALLPQFTRLGLQAPRPAPGTALVPFPRE